MNQLQGDGSTTRADPILGELFLPGGPDAAGAVARRKPGRDLM
jgi:hypothetical protein